MNLSRSSKSSLDPLSDVLAVLDAQATRTSRLTASGEWALRFPQRDRLKFVAVVKGTCWIERPGHTAEPLVAGDVCLIGRTAYTVSSHPGLPAIDGAPFYDGETLEELPVQGDDTIMLGGGIAVTLDDGGFLLNMLPAFALVPRLRAGAASVAAILRLLDIEMASDRIGSEAVAKRLAEVLLVEAIRACTDGSVPIGWLKGLADPHLGRALALVHTDIAEPLVSCRAGVSSGHVAVGFRRSVHADNRSATARLHSDLAAGARSHHARKPGQERSGSGHARRLYLAKRIHACLSPRFRCNATKRLARGLTSKLCGWFACTLNSGRTAVFNLLL